MTTDQIDRVTRNELNFSGGPGALPNSVLEKAREAIETVPELGISILGVSHRSEWFYNTVQKAEQDLRDLLGGAKEHEIVFLQGGGSLQFAMVPMNFQTADTQNAQYITGGYWSKKSILEAASQISLEIAWDGKHTSYRALPEWDEIPLSKEAAYFHYVSNETVEGLQFKSPPPRGISTPICDMSSDFLSGPLNINDYGMVYAHAQKNIGPAGVTVALISKELLSRKPKHTLPPILDYRTHIASKSIYNTPPVFAIYVTGLVFSWLKDSIGGLFEMQKLNEQKSNMIYQALLARHDAIQLHAEEKHRSQMNVSFKFRDMRLETEFFSRLRDEGFTGLEGHRSIGGVRISLYNGVTLKATKHLSAFISDFLAGK
jgi:phosphoserine aminotransferase